MLKFLKEKRFFEWTDSNKRIYKPFGCEERTSRDSQMSARKQMAKAVRLLGSTEQIGYPEDHFS
jgi:hypothetical protein